MTNEALAIQEFLTMLVIIGGIMAGIAAVGTAYALLVDKY